MSGTDEDWPSRLLPTARAWLKAFALGTVLAVAALGAKAALSAPHPITTSKPAVVPHETVSLEGVYVRD